MCFYNLIKPIVNWKISVYIRKQLSVFFLLQPDASCQFWWLGNCRMQKSIKHQMMFFASNLKCRHCIRRFFLHLRLWGDLNAQEMKMLEWCIQRNSWCSLWFNKRLICKLPGKTDYSLTQLLTAVRIREYETSVFQEKMEHFLLFTEKSKCYFL